MKLTDDGIKTAHEYGVDCESRTVWLMGNPGIEHQEAAKFLTNLGLLESQGEAPVLVCMKTNGGEWAEGITVYDAISLSDCPITIHGYAHVRSMSSIVFQAADLRLLAPNSYMMLHHGDVMIEDDYRRAQSAMKFMERADERAMVRIYAERMKGVGPCAALKLPAIEQTIRDSLDQHGNWYLTPKEAVHWGLADGILGE